MDTPTTDTSTTSPSSLVRRIESALADPGNRRRVGARVCCVGRLYLSSTDEERAALDDLLDMLTPLRVAATVLADHGISKSSIVRHKSRSYEPGRRCACTPGDGKPEMKGTR